MAGNNDKILQALNNLGENFCIPKPLFSDVSMPDYFDEYNIDFEARNYVLDRIQNGPSRKVGERTDGNICSQFPSNSMQHSTNSESSTQELHFYIKAEVDPFILGYYDQPPQVEIKAHDKNGTLRRRLYTPDALLITKHGLSVVQIKPSKIIEKLCAKYPKDWKHESNSFSFLPASNYFSKINIGHYIWSPSVNSKIEISNFMTLLQLPKTLNKTHENEQIHILERLKKTGCDTINNVISSCKIKDTTSILCLIRDKKIFANLSTQLITDINSFWVGYSKNDLLIADEIEDHFVCKGLPNDYVNDKTLAVKNDLQEAFRRLEISKNGVGRSARRYRELIKKGKLKNITPLESLLPKRRATNKNDGRKKIKIADKVYKYLIAFIDENHGDIRKLKLCAAYAEYRLAASQNHKNFEPVSRPTFQKYLDNYDDGEKAFSRGGQRKKNAMAPPTDTNERALKPTRPFELVTSDHYNMDIFCKSLETGEKIYTARPWLSILKDIATGFILAIWISFGAPSRTSCAAMLRLCARQHGRWPEQITVDRGSEFQSVYFQAVLANKKVVKHDRPASHSRFGSEAERFFQGLRTQYLNHLPGNFVDGKEGRETSSSHQAKNAKLINLDELIQHCIRYCYWYNNFSLGSNFDAPVVTMKNSLLKFPFSGIPITVDHKFIIETSVDSNDYKLHPQRGIHCGPYHYWNTRLSSINKRRLEVRLDPENPYVIYANAEGKWLSCSVNKNKIFELKTDIEKRVIIAKESLPHALLTAQKNDANQKRLLSTKQKVFTEENRIDHNPPNTVDTKNNDEDIYSFVQKNTDDLDVSEW